MFKQEFSNIDVFIIIRELDEILRNSIINNVYMVEDLFILKLNSDKGKINLVVKKDARINLTSYQYPIPKYPNQFIISFRKFLKNKKIKKIYQHNFDRIVIIELDFYEETPWKLIIELFNKGNFILSDSDDTVKVAKSYKKFRERNILPNKLYEFPKSHGQDFLQLNREMFYKIIESSDTDIVRTIARNVNISGLYSEEICLRANIDRNLLASELDGEQIGILYQEFKKFRNQLLFQNLKANIVLDSDSNMISVLPFDLLKYSELEKKYFSTFNEAVDEYFSKIDYKSINIPQNKQLDEKIKSQKKILKNQLEYIQSLKAKIELNYAIGELIYSNFNSIQKLYDVISDAKKKGYNWESINSTLINAKEKSIEGAEIFKKIIPSNKKLIVELATNEVELDLNKSVGENANIIFERGKKAKKKLEGTYKAVETTQKKIKSLENKKDLTETSANSFLKKPSKRWYEKYRWFVSSDNFLIIGGRDASSNESIFKKHLEDKDLVFHTIIPGSPLVVVKNESNENIPQNTIEEAAIFVASYSKAWKESWSTLDVFYVAPTQISKTPPSGEYLPKGSFIITGKKKILKNIKMELYIGIKFIELKDEVMGGESQFYPQILSGPKMAIQKQTICSVKIIPSRNGLTSGNLAKNLKQSFIENVPDNYKNWIRLVSVDEIVLKIPTGLSKVV